MDYHSQRLNPLLGWSQNCVRLEVSGINAGSSIDVTREVHGKQLQPLPAFDALANGRGVPARFFRIIFYELPCMSTPIPKGMDRSWPASERKRSASVAGPGKKSRPISGKCHREAPIRACFRRKLKTSSCRARGSRSVFRPGSAGPWQKPVVDGAVRRFPEDARHRPGRLLRLAFSRC